MPDPPHLAPTLGALRSALNVASTPDLGPVLHVVPVDAECSTGPALWGAIPTCGVDPGATGMGAAYSMDPGQTITGIMCSAVQPRQAPYVAGSQSRQSILGLAGAGTLCNEHPGLARACSRDPRAVIGITWGLYPKAARMGWSCCSSLCWHVGHLKSRGSTRG